MRKYLWVAVALLVLLAGLAQAQDHAESAWPVPDADLSNFTFTVDLSDLDASWWAAVDTTDPTKGRVYKGDGTTELAADWIGFDSGTERGWVRILWSGTVSSSTAGTVRIYPPKASNSSYLATDTYGAENAYDANWIAYWPFESGGVDRTGNSLDLTANGGIGVTAGLVGNASNQLGSGYYWSRTGVILGGASHRTVMAWSRTTTLADQVIAAWGDPTGTGTKYVFRIDEPNGDVVRTEVQGGYIVGTTGVIDATPTWHHVVSRFGGTNVTDVDHFVDGVLEISGLSSPATIDTWTGVGLMIGGDLSTPTSKWYTGLIDELQIHSDDRSDAWVKYERLQTVDNTAFWGAWTWVAGSTNPYCTGITLADSNPTSAASVDFNVAFSEPVTGVTTSSFALDQAGLTGPAIDSVSGSGTTWTVTVSTGTGDGSLSIDLLDDPAIVDAESNGLTGGYANGQTYTVDKTGPSGFSITRTTAQATSAMTVDFSMVFDEAVVNVNHEDFELDVAEDLYRPHYWKDVESISNSIINVSGSGTTYIVTAVVGAGEGSFSIDLIDGSNITDLAGNALTGGFTAGEAYTVSEDRLADNLTKDSQGWTVLPSSPDTTVIYVDPVDGDNTNDGLTESTPKQSVRIQDFNAWIDDNSADHMLIKRGTSWNDLMHISLSGRSPSEPIVIGTYGEGPRPIIDGLRIYNGHKNIIIRGFEWYDANDSSGGVIVAEGASENIWMEDCFARDNGVSVQKILPEKLPNRWFTFYRCYFVDNVPPVDAHAQGAYISGVFGTTFDQCVFHKNGYSDRAVDATAYNHHLYTWDPAFLLKDSLMISPSSHGAQLRFGGTVTGNVFEDAPYGVNLGATSAGTGYPSTMEDSKGSVTDNVFAHSTRIDGVGGSAVGGTAITISNTRPDIEIPILRNVMAYSDSTYGDANGVFTDGSDGGADNILFQANVMVDWKTAAYIGSDNIVDGVEFDGNYFLNKTISNLIWYYGNATYPQDPTQHVFTGNYVYDSGGSSYDAFNIGGTGYTFAEWQAASGDATSTWGDVALLDETRDLAAYNGWLGGTTTRDAFMSEARANSQADWKPEYTGFAAREWIAAGYQPVSSLSTEGVASSPATSSSTTVTVSYAGAGAAETVRLWTRYGTFGTWTDTGSTNTGASGSWSHSFSASYREIYYAVEEDGAGAPTYPDSLTLYDVSAESGGGSEDVTLTRPRYIEELAIGGGAGDADGGVSMDSEGNVHISGRLLVNMEIETLPWSKSVADRFDPTSALPTSPSEGDRYLATATANGWTVNSIYQYSGSAWVEIVPVEGMVVWVDDEDAHYVYNGSVWSLM